MKECVYACVEEVGNGHVHQSIQNATRPHVFRIRHRALCLYEDSILRPRETHWGHYLASASPASSKFRICQSYLWLTLFYIYII